MAGSQIKDFPECAATVVAAPCREEQHQWATVWRPQPGNTCISEEDLSCRRLNWELLNSKGLT